MGRHRVAEVTHGLFARSLRRAPGAAARRDDRGLVFWVVPLVFRFFGSASEATTEQPRGGTLWNSKWPTKSLEAFWHSQISWLHRSITEMMSTCNQEIVQTQQISIFFGGFKMPFEHHGPLMQSSFLRPDRCWKHGGGGRSQGRTVPLLFLQSGPGGFLLFCSRRTFFLALEFSAFAEQLATSDLPTNQVFGRAPNRSTRVERLSCLPQASPSDEQPLLAAQDDSCWFPISVIYLDEGVQNAWNYWVVLCIAKRKRKVPNLRMAPIKPFLGY